jgi:hypothetical protein
MILAVSRPSLLASPLGEGERIKVRGFRGLTLSALPRLNPHPLPLPQQGEATQARVNTFNRPAFSGRGLASTTLRRD